jgi:glycosyltransferase involved in cell wall biosynthesis
VIPVLWISRHDKILSRGYADQGLLEAILDRSLWRPPDALDFEHHENMGRSGGGFPSVVGAVVILPARHHASDEDVSWFLVELARLSWYVVILSGDEEWIFPWSRVPRDERRRVWVMQPRLEHADMDGLIPGGWYPGTREGLHQIGADPHDSRHYDWMFAGQITHKRREQMAQALRGLGRGLFHPTAGYLQGMPRVEYLKNLSHSKIAPCPSGPMTVDTARPLEALEAGCVPIVDTVTPRDEAYDYWALCFGEDCPLPQISDWSTFPAMLRAELARWPHNANQLSAWWQGWKRRIALQLEGQIREAAGLVSDSEAPDDLITVLVTTSPVPANPATDHIEETIRLSREQLPTAEIVIAIDGVRPEQEDRAPAYAEYVRRLLWLTNHCWSNVVPYLASRWLHQAALTREALSLVRTPLTLFVEHDRPPLGQVPWPALCRAVLHDEVRVARLHAEAEIHPEHQYLMADPEPRTYEGIPLRRTFAWWQHPHLVRTGLYREWLSIHFGRDARTMIEDRMYSLVESAWKDDGPSSWDRWRITIYQPDGDMKRSTHLDARGSDPMYPMYMGRAPRSFRLGLIVRMDNRGLGTQTWELYRHLRPDKTLAIDMGQWSPYVQNHPERFPDARIAAYDGRGGFLPDADVEWILSDVDVLLTAETPYDHRIYALARERGVRTVCQPNPEFWRPTLDPNLPLPDLCANPSRWREDVMPGVHVPHPVDRERLPFRFRTEARRFLHIHGHLASNDRHGTELVLEALSLCRTKPDLTIRTQGRMASKVNRMTRILARQTQGRIHVMQGDVRDYWELYEGFDVLLSPRRYGGLSLPMQEAASTGMVVVATDRMPERFDLPPEGLVPVASTRMHHYPGGDVAIESADSHALAAKMDELVENPTLVERLSGASDEWAESISWDTLLPQWEALLERVSRMETSAAVGVRV